LAISGFSFVLAEQKMLTIEVREVIGCEVNRKTTNYLTQTCADNFSVLCVPCPIGRVGGKSNVISFVSSHEQHMNMQKNYVFILFLLCSTASYSQHVDIDLLKDINLNRNENLDPTFEVVTNTVAPLSLAVPAGTIVYALIKKDEQHLQNAVGISSSMLVAGVVTTGLKFTVNRERPYDAYPFIDKVTSVTTPSFPSGHTTYAFALATSVSLAYQKWYIVVPSYIWAGAVGYSRMHLGLHYPSDVLAATGIGIGLAWLSQWLVAVI